MAGRLTGGLGRWRRKESRPADPPRASENPPLDDSPAGTAFGSPPEPSSEAWPTSLPAEADPSALERDGLRIFCTALAADLPSAALAARLADALAADAAIAGEDPPAQRDLLAQACAELSDLVSSPALTSRIAAGLGAAGYEPVDPVGETFDPLRHRAVEAQPVEDPALHNRVAATQRPGYAGHGRSLRLPEVVVYRAATPEQAAPQTSDQPAAQPHTPDSGT